jgi:hypothetical protein
MSNRIVYKRDGDPTYYELSPTPEEYRPKGCPDHFTPVCRVGSGDFVRWVDLDTFEKMTFPQKMEAGYARFEDGVFYPCMCNPHDKWNGWAKPSFTKEVYDQILKDINMEVKHVVKEENYNLLYVHLIEEDLDELDDHSLTYHFDNGTYYLDGWMWDFYTEEQKQKVEERIREEEEEDALYG